METLWNQKTSIKLVFNMKTSIGAIVAVLISLFVFVNADGSPIIIEKPRDQYVKNGGTVLFFCKATGHPPPEIIWRKIGDKSPKKIISTNRFTVIPGLGFSVLRIDVIRSERDEGRYECLTQNSGGEQTASAKLLVYPENQVPHGFPYITRNPVPTPQVEKGRNTTLICEVEGNPPPVVTWIRDSHPLNLSNSRYRVTMNDNVGRFDVFESDESDQGRYECVAENKIGTVVSPQFTLQVRVRRVPPYFVQQILPIHEVKAGTDLNITCKASGSPLPYVRWRRGPEELTPEDQAPLGGNILFLSNVHESANYTCLATSKLGTVEATTLVKVESLPYSPTNLRISDVTPTSVYLSWIYDGPIEDLRYFVIQYKAKDSNSNYEEISGVSTHFYTVTKLNPYTEYEFYVLAENHAGRGPPSVPAFMTTGETEPRTAPRNVQARPLSSTSMLVQWEEPDNPNGIVTGYKIYYTTNPHLPMTDWDSQYVDSTTLTTIPDLTPHTIYTIRVQAFTNIGPGPFSAPVQVKTQQGVPSQPLSLRAIDVTATSVSLEWTKPIHTGDNIISYELYWNDTSINEKGHRTLAVIESYKLDKLQPNTLYHIWLAAKSRRGEGAYTSPIAIKTDQYMPEAPPENVRAEAVDSQKIRVTWEAPPEDQQNGIISGYRLHYVENYKSDNSASIVTLPGISREFIIEDLRKYTEYRIWILAFTEVGDGPPSYVINVRTEEDVPGDPQNVKVQTINSTAIRISWQPPLDKEQHGIIRGYQIHIQELDTSGQNFPNVFAKRYDVVNVEEYVVSDLQPDTMYQIQVSAVTRKGDGQRSLPKEVKMPGGVPNRPQVTLKFVKEEPTVSIDVEWSRPALTYGELIGYRLRYGPKDEDLEDITLEGRNTQHKRLEGLERGVEYEFRVAGINAVGVGQEGVQIMIMPEGPPSGPPINITHRFQTADVMAIQWDHPIPEHRNGKIIMYTVFFNKRVENSVPIERNTTGLKAVFPNLEENIEYEFRIRALTSKGPGPYSERIIVRTERELVRAPMNIRAIATSYNTLEVWWEMVPSRGKVIGYQVFYAMTPVEDMDEWSQKGVPVTHSAELTGLERNSQYAITVAARTKSGFGRLSEKVTVTLKPEEVPKDLRTHDVHTHGFSLSWQQPIRLKPVGYKVTYDAIKEFVDAQGITQTVHIPMTTIDVPAQNTSMTLNDLTPFTTYNVNVSAVGSDKSYRPPSRLTVTTQMAAPLPIVNPDFYGVFDGEEIGVILPQASEEYGPISHYFLVVVPEDKKNMNRNPDTFLTHELVNSGRSSASNKLEDTSPYIAARFIRRNVPYNFRLGDGKEYNGFVNKRLENGKIYRVFLRAVVDTPQKHLDTSSQMSEPLSLDMKEAPPGEPPQRPNPQVPLDSTIIPLSRDHSEAGIFWIMVPIFGALALGLLVTMLFVCIKRRRIPNKNADHSVTKPLMSSVPMAELGSANTPTDPVELRRMTFQTPGMASHPPIPVADFTRHVELLRASDGAKFSQEYESIETGQQFTWEHSNLDVNRPKNRYANVIAYDHSRLVLEPVPGVPGSDYINANYCDGYRKRNAYIATQGPLPETFADFWRMVWEQRSMTIVMMTRLEERARIKCDQYWPSRGSDTYGVVSVTLLDVQELATYCVRTFQLHRLGTSEHREVRQLQFTAWPDHGVPDHPAPFLMFLKRIRAVNPVDAGPLVIHCSAGVGRTGCFAVIDSTLERMKHENTVDIYGHVTCLRAQRNYMVQTEDQYIFIHDAILEAIQSGNTEVHIKNLHNHVQSLTRNLDPSSGTGTLTLMTGLKLEFRKLANYKLPNAKFHSATLPVNKTKNRLINILPYENTRVCLQPLRSVEGSDYINASIIDGYRWRGAYIATQGPLPETTEDFWRMLWEHNSTIIVMLTKLREMGQEKCHQYWPNDRSIRYMCYVVEPVAEYNMPQYILREFKVTDARDGQSRTVRQFQFTDWPEEGCPKSAEGFIEFIGQVHKTKEQFGQEGPITVHCSAGVGRSGVFIAMSIILERMQYECVCDVFQTARILRAQRPAMVQTEDQYEFCYRAALEYLSSFDHYEGMD